MPRFLQKYKTRVTTNAQQGHMAAIKRASQTKRNTGHATAKQFANHKAHTTTRKQPCATAAQTAMHDNNVRRQNN
jgi:hypothetical protein